jgi:hypothetical protein
MHRYPRGLLASFENRGPLIFFISDFLKRKVCFDDVTLLFDWIIMGHRLPASEQHLGLLTE